MTTNHLPLCRYCGGEAKEHLLVCRCVSCGARTKNFTACGGEYQREQRMAEEAWARGEYERPPLPLMSGLGRAIGTLSTTYTQAATGYPNIEAIAQGTIANDFREWPLVRPEAQRLLAELRLLRVNASTAAQLRAALQEMVDAFHVDGDWTAPRAVAAVDAARDLLAQKPST